MPAGNKKRHRTGRLALATNGSAGRERRHPVNIESPARCRSCACDSQHVLIAGRGSCGWAISMAAGEYVSVHSQAVTEQADLVIERTELKADDKGEHKELMAIYVARGLEPALAKRGRRAVDDPFEIRHPQNTCHYRCAKITEVPRCEHR
jgi:hypothetical protein